MKVSLILGKNRQDFDSLNYSFWYKAPEKEKRLSFIE
jgi:hypothetical protein